MCRWSPALLSNIRTDASPTPRGTKTAADCPAANTVSNRSTATRLVRPSLGRYHHMEAVGLIYVIDQGGAVGPEFCPMAGDGSDIRRLGRHRTGDGQRGGSKEGSHRAHGPIPEKCTGVILVT
jgi:hypothetical protein